MYLLLLLFIVIVFYPNKDGFKNALKPKKVDNEKERLKKEAEKKFKTQNYKITNEERQGILTSHSYM